MKNLLLIGLLSILFSFESAGQKKELKYASDFAQLKKLLKTDSVLRFEYACAKEFHKYLNAYRIIYQKQPLRWNDTLWVVAMNHGNYLSENNLFNHKQIVGKPLFSGINPTNRHEFVVKSELKPTLCGENLFMASYDKNSTPDENAYMAFKAWVKSKGHNENMLREPYQEHGTAVVITKTFNIIFTDVLLSLSGSISRIKKAGQTTTTMTTEEINKLTPPVDKGLTSSALKKLINHENWTIEFLQYFPKSIIYNRHLNAACAKSTESFLEQKYQDKNLKKQLKKVDEISEIKFNILQPKILDKILGKGPFQESILFLAIQTTSVDIERIKTELVTMMKSHIEKTIKPIKKVGFHLNWKKRGKHFLICASVQSS
jgi:uncharacterized protein YkwD